jgi:hypothetical protein
MTKWEAMQQLQTIMDRWIDFEEWAYLQLEMRGEWSDERQLEVEENHKTAEKRRVEFEAETWRNMEEMKSRGATAEEIDGYHRTRWPEHDKLVTAWRSLDGAAES